MLLSGWTAAPTAAATRFNLVTGCPEGGTNDAAIADVCANHTQVDASPEDTAVKLTDAAAAHFGQAPARAERPWENMVETHGSDRAARPPPIPPAADPTPMPTSPALRPHPRRAKSKCTATQTATITSLANSIVTLDSCLVPCRQQPPPPTNSLPPPPWPDARPLPSFSRRGPAPNVGPFLFLAVAAALSASAGGGYTRTPNVNAEVLGNATLRALYPNHLWDIAVQPSDTPRGPTRVELPHVPFIAVQTDEDQLPLYDENLELDLAPWRRRNRSEVTVSALLGWAARLPKLASQRVVMVKEGRLALLQQKSGGLGLTCEKPCDVVLDELLEDLRSWLAESPSEWPDVVFFLNAADTSLCQQQDSISASGNVKNSADGAGGAGGGASQGSNGGVGRRRSKSGLGRCPAPVLSLIKEWGRHKDEDILVPITMDMRGSAPLQYFPWSRKIERAVFRGREYGHTRMYPYAPGVSSRTYMAYMTQYNPDWAAFVDVGLVDNYTYHLPYGNHSTVHITGRGFVQVSELARFRYVLALDGITASSRLARLLSLNSVVLKQASPWIEWYYRSLVPGTHYVSVWTYHRSDVLQVIRSIRHKGRYLYDIATHGQAFAYRYLSPAARRLYWLQALREYRKLFADMDDFMAAQEIPEVKPRTSQLHSS